MKGTYYWVPQGTRNKVSKKSGGVCFHCKKKAVGATINKRGVLCFYDKDERIYHLDHLKKIAAGGDHTEENMVISCANCNLSTRKKKAGNDPEVISLMKKINGK